MDSSVAALNKKQQRRQNQVKHGARKNNEKIADLELSDLELEKTVRVSLKGHRKIVDQKKTLNYLKIDEVVISFLYTEIVDDNLLIFGNFFIRNNQLVYVLRMCIYLSLLVTSQWLPELQSLMIFLLEFFYMFIVLMSFL